MRPRTANKVTCKEHGRTRLEKFCSLETEKDDSGIVIGTYHTCLPEHKCTVPDKNEARPSGGGGGTGKRPPARYYDLSAQARPIENKKVCFACGLDDHEKPNCTNHLCRTCHGVVDPMAGPHICGPPPRKPSSFLTGDTSGFDNDLETVRCMTCDKYGHMNCSKGKSSSKQSPVPPYWRPMCAYCAQNDHHAFDCPNSFVDKWVDYNTRGQRRRDQGAHYSGGRGQDALASWNDGYGGPAVRGNQDRRRWEEGGGGGRRYDDRQNYSSRDRAGYGYGQSRPQRRY